MWPSHILEKFSTDTLSDETCESRFYGPWNAFLNHLFPSSDHFTVVPLPTPRTPTTVTHTTPTASISTIFVVRHHNHPVFLLSINPPSHLRRASTRRSADEVTRAMYFDLFDEVEIETLWGVSAMGSRCCFYKYAKEGGTLLPASTPMSTSACQQKGPGVIADTAPVERWEVDVLEGKGEETLRTVVNHVTIMCGLRG